MKTTPLFTVALALLAIGAINARADIIIQDLDLQGVDYQTPGPGSTAGYVPTSPTTGYAQITSPDNVPGGPGNAVIPQINDTGLIVVDNGYDGVELGTLSSLIAAGAAGHVSFDLLSEGGQNGLSTNGQYAYWDILLSDPSNPGSTALVNAYSDNKLGANPLNEDESVQASTIIADGNAGAFAFGSTWATVEGTLVGVTDLGNWNVTSVSIGVGGWDTGTEGIGQIGSITLPGSSVPEPSTWALMVGGIAALVFVSRRRALRA